MSTATASEMKSGKELFDHLKEGGTGRDRLNMLAEHLKGHPSASAAACVEWMISDEWVERYRGTVVRAGVFAYGDQFTLNTPGVSAEEQFNERLTVLRQENDDLKASNAQLRATNQRLTREVETLRTRVLEQNSLQREDRVRDEFEPIGVKRTADQSRKPGRKASPSSELVEVGATRADEI